MKVLSILNIILLFNSIASLIIVLLERKKPEKTVAWLFIMLLLPTVGLLTYLVYGHNWNQRKPSVQITPGLEKLVKFAEEDFKTDEYNRFIELFAHNSGSPVFTHNEITIFKDGIEKFRYLKEELLKSKHHIHLEYYTFRSDSIGTEIKDILVKKAKEGIKVKFIIDRLGSKKLRKSYISELKSAGVDIVWHSPSPLPLLKFIGVYNSYRNHRKIAIIDGIIGFIGGVNIGDEYISKSKYGYWRDTHLMVRGDFVLGLQNIFLDNFMTIKETNNNITLEKENLQEYFPPSCVENIKIMQLIRSGPDTKFYSAIEGILKMITSAESHVYITTPYFVPPQGIMEALKLSALSGVDVRILFPNQCDELLMHHASLNYLVELIKYGVKIYLYDKKSFVHAKTVTIDGKYCIAGSTNIDILSFEYNYEASAVIYDTEITHKLEIQFFEDIKHSELMTEDYYRNSPSHLKALQILCRTLSGML